MSDTNNVQNSGSILGKTYEKVEAISSKPAVKIVSIIFSFFGVIATIVTLYTSIFPTKKYSIGINQQTRLFFDANSADGSKAGIKLDRGKSCNQFCYETLIVLTNGGSETITPDVLRGDRKIKISAAGDIIELIVLSATSGIINLEGTYVGKEAFLSFKNFDPKASFAFRVLWMSDNEVSQYPEVTASALGEDNIVSATSQLFIWTIGPLVVIVGAAILLVLSVVIAFVIFIPLSRAAKDGFAFPVTIAFIFISFILITPTIIKNTGPTERRLFVQYKDKYTPF